MTKTTTRQFGLKIGHRFIPLWKSHTIEPEPKVKLPSRLHFYIWRKNWRNKLYR